MNRTILICFCLLVSCFSCDDRTTNEKIYRESFIAPQFEGIVSSTDLWKGGLLVIYLKDKDKVAQINNNHDVLEEIKKGDFFNKTANSNECYIKGGDSIFYFDCVDLKRLNEKARDSLRDVKQWDRTKINRWTSIKN